MLEVKIKTINDKTMIAPLPKSGSNKINKKTPIITPNIGSEYDTILSMFLSFLDKYFETKIINATLAISLGCIPNDPIPNQLLLPFLTIPIPGIKTRIRSIIDPNSILLACL